MHFIQLGRQTGFNCTNWLAGYFSSVGELPARTGEQDKLFLIYQSLFNLHSAQVPVSCLDFEFFVSKLGTIKCLPSISK